MIQSGKNTRRSNHPATAPAAHTVGSGPSRAQPALGVSRVTPPRMRSARTAAGPRGVAQHSAAPPWGACVDEIGTTWLQSQHVRKRHCPAHRPAGAARRASQQNGRLTGYWFYWFYCVSEEPSRAETELWPTAEQSSQLRLGFCLYLL